MTHISNSRYVPVVQGLIEFIGKVKHLRHVSDGPRYVYLPTRTRETARKSALRHLMDTFFDNSVESTVAALLDVKSKELTETDLDRIQRLIDEARQTGR